MKTSIIRLSTDLTKFLISSGVMGWKTSWITSHNVFLLSNCRQLVYKRLFVMSQTYSVGFNSMELARHFINLAPLNPILSRNVTVLLAECAGAPSYITRPQIRDLIAASRPLKLGTYIGTPKTMQILLGLCRYTKTPRPIFYHIGTPKSIGILLGLCLIILVSYNGLGRTVFLLAREEQIMFKAPPPFPPPPLFDLGTPKTIGILLGLCSMILVSYNVLSLTIIP